MTVQTKKTLTKLKLVQWHYFNNETINLKNTNLFSGDNSAGKSTILDAIKLVLTTDSRKFNLAANADSRRSLKGYVRGKTGFEENEYTRNGYVISYVAVEVYEEKRDRYFVIGGKFDSPDAESSVGIKWFCEEGRLDNLSFIVDNRPADNEKFLNNGRKVNFIYQTSEARKRFFHRLGNLQDNFSELIHRSMAFQPMKNVKSFVSQFILPEKNIDINTLRENIRILDEFRHIVDETNRNVIMLENIRNAYNKILGIERQITVIEIMLKIAERESKEENIKAKTKEHEENSRLCEYYNREKADILSSLNTTWQRLRDIRAAITSNGNNTMINNLERDINERKKDADSEKTNIKKLDEQISRISNALAAIKIQSVKKENLDSLKNDAVSFDIKNEIVCSIKSELDENETYLNIRTARLETEIEDYNRKLVTLTEEINRLNRNEITYNKNVMLLKTAVEKEFRARGINSDVHIFSDLLETNNIRWQNAVEGYLNTQRFHLIVEPQYFGIALKVYNRLRNNIHTAAIVNTGRLDMEIRTEKNSLASVIETENRYARAYADYLLGRVVMCDNVPELQNHEIAVTSGCMLYQGKAVRRINPEIYRMPYIGKYAIKKQLEQKLAEYEKLKAESEERKLLCRNLKKTLRLIKLCNTDILSDVINSPEKLKNIESEIAELNIKLNEANNDPTYLQLKDDEYRLENDLNEKNIRRDRIICNINNHESIIRSSENAIAKLDSEIAIIEKDISDMSHENDNLLFEAEKKFNEHKKNKSADNIFSNLRQRKSNLLKAKEEANKNLIELQAKYANGELGTGVEMMSAYEERYIVLARQNLIRYKEELLKAQENAETEFRENFLAKLKENIENAETLFRNLNKTLRPLYYGNDSYKFDCFPNPGKKHLYDMIMSDFNIGGFNLFSEQLDRQYHDEMDELFAKLTVSDSGGEDVFNEYIDYRNYLDYDIMIISKSGRSQRFSKVFREKSGGETQTPYYVAIAASFVQLYNISESIRVIILDEAFDKMDEERIKSMIDFFKSQDLQIILAAPTSRLEIIGEETENIIIAYRDDDYNSYIDEFHYDEYMQ